MISFRMLHLVVTALYTAAIFGPKKISVFLEDRNVMRKAKGLRGRLSEDFSLRNMPLVGAVVLLSMFDCSLLRFLPWKPSTIFAESKGFPTVSMLRWCMSTKAIQATVSVICQVTYLSTDSDLGKVPMTAQAKALFGLNISFALIGAIMGIIMLCLKDGLLSRIEKQEAQDAGHSATVTEEKTEDHATSGTSDISDFYPADGASTIDIDSNPATFMNPMLSLAGGVQTKDVPGSSVADESDIL